MINLLDYVSEELVKYLEVLSCDNCYVYKWNVISDFSKFYKILAQKKKALVLIVSSNYSDKDKIASTIKSMGDQLNVRSYMLICDKIDRNTFIVCFKKCDQ